MTAQQQLVDLMRNTDNRAGAWQFEVQHWIRDHGPAIAELLTAAMVLARWRIHWSKLRFDLSEQVRADVAEMEFRKKLVALTGAEWAESPTDKWLETEQLYWRPKLAPPPSAN